MAGIRKRFAARVEPDERGCLVWTGAPRGSRYGKFAIGGRLVRAHRWAFEQEFGPIPTGIELHHTCGNPRCVNVEHLRPVTSAEHRRKHRPNLPRSARLAQLET